VRLDDRAADREPHANFVVPHGAKNLATIITLGTDDHLARPGGDGRHRVDAIDDEIHDRLLKLDRVAQHHWQTGVKLQPQRWRRDCLRTSGIVSAITSLRSSCAISVAAFLAS
jgi:hypothetical protein